MTSGVLSLLCGSALNKQLQHTAVLYVCACSSRANSEITASQVKSVNSEAPPCLGAFYPVSHPEPPHCMRDGGKVTWHLGPWVLSPKGRPTLKPGP